MHKVLYSTEYKNKTQKDNTMTNNTTTTTRQMTAAEMNRLNRLSGKIETAKNFTQSVKATEQMDAFQERLLAKGVAVEAILEAMGN